MNTIGCNGMRRLLSAMVLGIAALLASSRADAHFRLLNPPQWIEESDAFGDPQKAPPCGVDSQTTYTLTHDVTSFAPGQKIQLHWVETIVHTGWFRISFSANRADFTDPPYATNPATGDSTDAGIENPPVAPVLVDGLYKHTMANTNAPKDYTYELTLPTKPCAKCTIQIEQIMLDHPVNQADSPFTYHHCADIAIVEDGDGGTAKVMDGGEAAGEAGTADDADGATTMGTGSTGDDSGGGEDTDASTGTGTGTTNGTSSGAGTGGATGNGTNTSSTSGGSNGCAASGRGATAAAGGIGLLLGAAAGIFRRRRRHPQR